jgi:hypothetical protein
MRPIRTFLLSVSLSLSLLAQGQPNCTGIALDVDARCGCVKDPNSQLCEMVKKGFYEPHDLTKNNLLTQSWAGTSQPAAASSQPTRPVQPKAQSAKPQPARPQQARVVPLTHKDYLRFLQPNAHMVAGFDFERALQTPEIVEALLGQGDSKITGALKEMDHLWVSFVAPDDVLILMTGKFEQGVTAGMFYAEGIRPVFLGSARVMMVGPEPSIQAALARLAKPASTGPAATEGWVVRRARELSQDHETFVVNELLAGTSTSNSALQAIRQFSLGFRLTGEGSIDGEAVADSEESALQISSWVDHMKSAGVLDSLNVTRDGSALRFDVKGDAFLTGDKGKAAMSSDVGVELYRLVMSGFPGMPARTVAEDRLRAVKAGMKREEVLSLLGPPLAVAAINGLDTPRETWTYQIPFGRQLSFKLDSGVVTASPR